MGKKEWVGLKFDMLTITENVDKHFVITSCECGKTGFKISKQALRNHPKKSCGCTSRISHEGETYNLLTIIKDYIIEKRWANKKTYRFCIARCECGNEIKVQTSRIISNRTKSCGCLIGESVNLKSFAFRDRNEESMYWAGFLAADGCVYKNKISIGLKESDVSHMYSFRDWIGAKTKIHYIQKSKSYNFSVGNKIIKKDLLDYGICERKSLTYDPPEFCEVSADFWRGMVDGDGHIGSVKRKTGYEFPIISLCGTKSTCEKFKNFVSTFCDSKVKVRPKQSISTIMYTSKYAIQIMKKLYGNNPKFYLDRKYELANRFFNFDLADNDEII